ncbi:hypothetical protein HWV62_36901 [Athelia sp. TMB]|nr:hypothetical protein HWV62_36901 [Athelia sp. TMB]
MSSKALLSNRILPLLLFPTISYYAFKIMFEYALQAGTLHKLSAHCTAPTPYTLAYTGIEYIDDILCSLVAFFDIMLEPNHSIPFNVELLTGLAALAIVPYLEAARHGRNPVLEIHWVLGIIYQKLTGGVIFPIYWMLFIVTGAAGLHFSPHRAGAGSIDQRHAESVVFTLVVAYILPSIAMLVMRDLYVIAFWQAFPLWMFLAQRLYLGLRPAAPQSGAKTVRAIYMSLFFLSSIPHIYLVTPILFRSSDPLQTLGTLFLPSFTPLDPKSTTLDHGVQDFIQWDGFFMLVSTFIAMLWIAGPSVKRLSILVVWLVQTVVFGPGAIIAGVFWWREALIQEGMDVEERKKST